VKDSQGHYSSTSIENIFDELSTSNQGLTTTDAQERIKKYGENVIAGTTVAWWQIMLRQFKSPFIYLLFAAAGLAVFLGEGTDAIFILLFIVINAALGFYQEYRSEQTAQLLKKFVESSVLVIRDGEEKTVQSKHVVPGDIICIAPGEIAAADIRLIETQALVVDESALTGESESVHKGTTLESNMLWGSTTITSGSGRGVVVATGSNKVLGTIAKLTIEANRVSSFEKGISGFSKFILRIVIVTLVLMVLSNILIKKGAVDLPELVLFAVALAVSVIPEALPVVTTFSLSQGARRLTQKKVVVKRLSAIEDLGSISVLCTDKTGTITQNNMQLTSALAYKGADVHLWAALGSDMVKQTNQPLNSFDHALQSRLSPSILDEVSHTEYLDETPFDPIHRTSALAVSFKKKKYLIMKGAPENVLIKCTQLQKKSEIEAWIVKQGESGHRVIAVSYRELTSNLKIENAEHEMTLAGLLSFKDPLKETTIEAVQKARAMGVQIKILTGDRPEVAGAVGVAIGLADSITDVLTGDQFEAMSEPERIHAVEKYHIFARTTPIQKYEIVTTLQKNNEVGFLGEGINDAPALKIANVGIVVQSASDISKEAADIILLNKSLLTIIEGIEEGRKVFSNTVKYIKATLTSNFGNFYAVAISSLFIPFLPMLPVQILLVNLLSDFPMIAIATDNVDPEELMSPKSYQVREVAIDATFLGIVSTVFDFMTFAIFFRLGESILQTNWFMVSILTELFLIFSIRTKKVFFKSVKVSRAIIILTIIAIPTTIILPMTQLGHDTFKFITPRPSDIATIIALVSCYFIATETAKLLLYKVAHRQATA